MTGGFSTGFEILDTSPRALLGPVYGTLSLTVADEYRNDSRGFPYPAPYEVQLKSRRTENNDLMIDDVLSGRIKCYYSDRDPIKILYLSNGHGSTVRQGRQYCFI